MSRHIELAEVLPEKIAIAIQIEDKAETQPQAPQKQETGVVPDNCANCPDSSCCRRARDSFHGAVGYEDS